MSIYPAGSRLLGLNAGLYYECVVLQSEERVLKKNEPPELAYKIHYLGWNKKWDTWLSAANLIKNDAAGQKIQEEAARELQERRERAVKAARSRKQKISNRKRKLDTMNEVDEGGEREDFDVELPIQMALGLKKLLVEDWEKVVQDQKLIRLPRSVTVTNILDLFVEAKKKKSSTGSASVHLEVAAGLREYFDRTLGKLLLYRIERVQYNELVASNATFSPSEWYGAEHLLRLFVKLPQLLGRLHLDTQVAEALQTRLQEVLKFLQKTPQRFFTAEYFHPDENYMLQYTTGKDAQKSTSSTSVNSTKKRK
jgi:mortality factor 4-like protein 1